MYYSILILIVLLLSTIMGAFRHEEAMTRIMDRIEMPDRLAQNLIMFIRQNSGTLPKNQREKEFPALTDNEVQSSEDIVQEVFEGFDHTANQV